MVRTHPFTPAAMLADPRRSPAVPNRSGTLALYSVLTHQLDAPSLHEVRIMDLHSRATRLAADGEKVHDANWIPGEEARDDVVYLRSCDGGRTEIVVVDGNFKGGCTDSGQEYVVDVVDAPIRALKMRDLGRGRVAFAVVGLVSTDGKLFNDEAGKKDGKSTIRVFDDFRVRTWNTYVKPQRYTIWYSVLALSSSSCSRKWILTAPLVPHVRRPHRDVPEGMYADDPSTALANFDVCRAGIAFIRESVGITRPHLQGAREVWFMPVEWEAVEKGVWQEDVEDEGTATGMVTTTVPTAGSSKNEFASLSVCGHVRFSPSGKRLAFLAAPLSDLAKVSIFVVAVPRDTSVWDPFNPRRGEETVRRVYDGTAPFYRSPSSLQRPEAERASVLLPPLSFEWAPSREKDGEEKTILVATEDGGRVRLDRLDFKSIEDVLASDNPHSVAEFEARRVTTDGTVAAYHPLPDEKWLVSSMSFVDSSLWTVVDASHDVLDRIEADDTTVPKPKVVSSATRHGKKFGLNHEEMVGEFWVDVGGAEVHTFVIRPMGWNHEKNRNKKWPWILMPHGGPESSWRDAWSTRWNMAVWAQKGCVIICPNVAGSLGYGPQFTARIYDSWGGAPLSDLHAVVAYLEEHSDDVLPELDFDRAALAGASYGGYMISWMFGEAPRGSRLSTTARIQSTGSLRPLAQRFRCAIWHDGIFSLPTFFLESDHCMGGPDFHGAPYPWRHVQNGKSSDSESPSGVSRILSSASLLHRWNPAAPLRLASWSRNAPPTLVIHSERDYRCPITEGLGVFKTLQAMGIDSRFVTFPDECHFVLGKHNALAWYEEMEAWLERWLR